MFAGPAVARCAFRRQVLHWGGRQRSLLPVNLSAPDCQRKECPLFSHRSRGGRSRIPALLALPSRKLSGDSSMAGNFEHSLASFTTDRREGGGRRRSGGSSGTLGSWIETPAPLVPAPFGRHANRSGSNAPLALCKETDRRN